MPRGVDNNNKLCYYAPGIVKSLLLIYRSLAGKLIRSLSQFGFRILQLWRLVQNGLQDYR